ncbi:hypothetical protein SJ842_004344 [Salmonella enterica]|uniref:hypothetical protein n=1 Tax=Enterobacteriaceae TaxID=543 RepID=UPI0009646A00|nr:hypothetical protein [Salmonella enterica]ECU7122382.1 hypothetical protein [Salmonella enterica subsp. enterica serovar Infantis]EHM4000936.1 hypothetical protein [Salmonella enterica subsp. enterica serovar Schwarzengrund]ELA5448774.1 hypothetical protein [Salmonella enterica subsp. enterica serovar Braenderup]ELF0029436.1 hypothetical protein [Salmonella enterica subsp. enterica serovar Amager]EHT4925276.1 hypothetical protein [Salmonella enterica]
MNTVNKYIKNKTTQVKKAIYSSKVIILTGGEATGKTSILNLLRNSSSNTRSEKLDAWKTKAFGLTSTKLSINTIIIDGIERDCLLLDDSRLEITKLHALMDYLRFKHIRLVLTTTLNPKEFKELIGHKQVKTFVLEHVEDDSKEDKVNTLMNMIAKIEHELKSLKSELANV